MVEITELVKFFNEIQILQITFSLYASRQNMFCFHDNAQF